MTDRSADLVRILEALTCSNPRCRCHQAARRGRGLVHCPAHDDRNPSLRVEPKADGTIAVKCYAGCDSRTVIDALRERGLWPSVRETRYEIRDPRGELVAVHVRRDGPNGKSFHWELPDGTPGLGGLPTAALPLYGIERLTPGSLTAILVEGEGCADALNALHALRASGVMAVATVTGAAVIPSDESLRPLVDRTIVLWPDADPPGRQHMRRIAERLAALGATDIRIIGWRNAPAGGDAVDAVALGGEALVRALIESAQPFERSQPEVAIVDEADPGDVPAWPILDQAAFHGLAGDFVRAVSAYTEADPAALLLTFLAAFGNALGPDPHVPVGTERHPLRIWPALMGATAKARKGSSLAPVLEVMRRADPEWAANCVSSGLASGEGLVWSVRDPIMGRERVKEGGEVRYAAIEVDPGVPDKRLLIIEEELVRVLRTLHRTDNTLAAVLRQAWDRDYLRTLTKNSPARATGAHITVVAHGVAEEIRRYLTEAEVLGGTVGRFLWALVRRARLLPDPPVPDEKLFVELAEATRRALEHGRTLRAIGRDVEANEAWCVVYGAISEPRPGLAGAATARMEAQALRLAGLYAALDLSPVVRMPHLEAALAVVEFCEASAEWLFADATEDALTSQVLRVLAGGRVTRTELVRVLGGHVPKRRLDAALRQLLAQGRIRTYRENTGGRPVTWIEAAPQFSAPSQ